MKLRLPSIAFLALVVPVAAVGALEACGGNEDNGDAGPDATSDAPPDVAKEAAAETGVDASCGNDADLTQYLPSADASFDVDAGLNISACTGCLKTSCGTDINACNTDCDCRQSVIDAVTCVTQGGSFESCGGNAILNGDQNVQNLFTCALSSCGPICIPQDGGAPKDGGSLDSGGGG